MHIRNMSWTFYGNDDEDDNNDDDDDDDDDDEQEEFREWKSSHVMKLNELVDLLSMAERSNDLSEQLMILNWGNHVTPLE